MANLQATTISGDLTSNFEVFDTTADISPWKKITHCVSNAKGADNQGTGLAYIHVRTPISTENFSGLGWNPYIMEVTGYHTYSGERFHDWKAVVNTNNDNNGFYGSNIRVDKSLKPSDPYVYQSANTYGGARRLCFSMLKYSCCCTGYFWVRFWKNAGYRDDYPWATDHDNSQTAQVF
jgi:hypothetical protein